MPRPSSPEYYRINYPISVREDALIRLEGRLVVEGDETDEELTEAVNYLKEYDRAQYR